MYEKGRAKENPEFHAIAARVGDPDISGSAAQRPEYAGPGGLRSYYIFRHNFSHNV